VLGVGQCRVTRILNRGLGIHSSHLVNNMNHMEFIPSSVGLGGLSIFPGLSRSFGRVTQSFVLNKLAGNRSRALKVLGVIGFLLNLGLITAPAWIMAMERLKRWLTREWLPELRAVTVSRDVPSVVVRVPGQGLPIETPAVVRPSGMIREGERQTLRPCSLRVRRRSKWVGILQEMLQGRLGVVGALKRRWWTPDLPTNGVPYEIAAAAHLSLSGLRILSWGSSTFEAQDKESTVHEVRFCNVQCESGNVYTILPDLYCKLHCLVFGRARNAATFLSLRNRYLEDTRELGVSQSLRALALAGTVGLAFRYSNGEEAIRQDLAEDGLSFEGPLC